MESLNVFGKKLELCSTNPMTGFYRNGCCDTGPKDYGTHTVCAVVTDEFLKFPILILGPCRSPNIAIGLPNLFSYCRI